MINVKIDKGISTMTFAGSGLEIAAEICEMVHGLYTQLYHRAGPAMAKGCIETYPFCPCVESSIGKTIFLTREEAEKALEAMRKEEVT